MFPVDLAAQDETLATWAFVHPIAMAGVLVLGLFVYATGMGLRDRRVKKQPASQEQKHRHTRIAQPFVVLFLIGFIAGPVSAVYTRGFAPMNSAHGWLGAMTLLLFAAAGSLGMGLKRGRSSRAAAHGLLGVFAGMVALAAAIAGIELLP